MSAQRGAKSNSYSSDCQLAGHLERFLAVHPSGPTDWDNEQSRKDAGVFLSDSSPSRTRENLLNLREHLNNLVKYRLPRSAPRDSDAVSLGRRQGNCILKSTFVILSLSVVCLAALHQCGTCQKAGPCLRGLLLCPCGLPLRKGLKCSPAPLRLQCAHESLRAC